MGERASVPKGLCHKPARSQGVTSRKGNTPRHAQPQRKSITTQNKGPTVFGKPSHTPCIALHLQPSLKLPLTASEEQ